MHSDSGYSIDTEWSSPALGVKGSSATKKTDIVFLNKRLYLGNRISRANFHRSMDYNYRWSVASKWCCSHGWAFRDSSNDKQKSDGALLDIIEQEGIHRQNDP